VGLSDQSRGVVPWSPFGWFWASMSCLEGKDRIGLNFGYSGDADSHHSATDDAFWVNGKLYKLDATVVEKVSDKVWKFKTYEKEQKHKGNRIDLTYEIEDSHYIKENYIITKISFKSNYGRVSGTFEFEGKTIKVSPKFMIVEEMAALW